MIAAYSVPVRDWRKPYDDLYALPSAGFAWEAARRSVRFRKVWSDCEFDAFDIRDGMRVVTIGRRADPFPCLWSSSPDDDATHAAIAWNPLLSQRVLRGVALPARLAHGSMLFDPSAFDLEKTLVIRPDGSQELILRDGVRALQIHVIGGTLGAGDALVVDMAGTRACASQLNALAAYRELRTTGVLLNKYFPPHPSAVRTAMCFQAVDGYLAGAPHREIAAAMFGAERAAADWNNPDRHLRDRVRRAFTRGLYLIERGYLGFLQ